MEEVTERITTEADGPETVNERLSTGGPGPEGQEDTVTERLSGATADESPDAPDDAAPEKPRRSRGKS